MIITVISYSVNRVTQRMLPRANYFSRELYTPFSGRTLRHMKKEEPPPRYVLSPPQRMDSYEAFIDEYVAFLQKYNQNPTDLSLLNDYATYMSKYADLAAKFEAWESEDLNTAELAYYLEVQSRVSQKLLAVS